MWGDPLTYIIIIGCVLTLLSGKIWAFSCCSLYVLIWIVIYNPNWVSRFNWEMYFYGYLTLFNHISHMTFFTPSYWLWLFSAHALIFLSTENQLCKNSLCLQHFELSGNGWANLNPNLELAAWIYTLWQVQRFFFFYVRGKCWQQAQLCIIGVKKYSHDFLWFLRITHAFDPQCAPLITLLFNLYL